MLELTVRLVVSLAVVVGLLMVLARLGGKRFRGAAGALVQVVHRQPLSRSSSIAVVSVGKRVLLLGTTEQQVTLLAELDPDDVLGDEDEDGDGPGEVLELPDDLSVVPGLPAPDNSRLAGSVLSAATWRQAISAARGGWKAS